MDNILTLNDLYSLKIQQRKSKEDTYYRIDDIPEIFSAEELKEKLLLNDINKEESEEVLLKKFLNSSVGKIKYSILQDKMNMESIKSNLKKRDTINLSSVINYLNPIKTIKKGKEKVKPENSFLIKNIEKASQTRKEFDAKFHPAKIKRKFINKEKDHNANYLNNMLKYTNYSKTPSNQYLNSNFVSENLDDLKQSKQLYFPCFLLL